VSPRSPTGPSLLSSALAALGRPVLAAGRYLGDLAALTSETVGAIGRGRTRWALVAAQADAIGTRSVPFIAVTLGVLGFISVWQVATQISQILPDFSMVGAAFIQMMVREFAPTITGLMVATRVGSGIAAEIGSMVVTEQVDALRMCNADPVSYLVAPRTLACTVMLVMLTVIGTVFATLCGLLIAESAFAIPRETFLSLQLTGIKDVLVGLCKALSYGFAIPIIAAHAGLTTTGGSAGVGWATTRAVVNTSFAVIVLDFAISGLAFVVGA
jgi:phospholipid/cholesterol/gamma-HCH transport system permease protein